jgi:hypothetical protein
MQTDRQELVRAAGRRVRRGKRTAGRVVVSALGFAMAYYFDTEHGEERRRHLHQAVRHAVHSLQDARSRDLGDPPPVFHPMLRTHRAAATVDQPRGPAAAAR